MDVKLNEGFLERVQGIVRDHRAHSGEWEGIVQVSFPEKPLSRLRSQSPWISVRDENRRPNPSPGWVVCQDPDGVDVRIGEVLMKGKVTGPPVLGSLKDISKLLLLM